MIINNCCNPDVQASETEKDSVARSCRAAADFADYIANNAIIGQGSAWAAYAGCKSMSEEVRKDLTKLIDVEVARRKADRDAK